MPARVTPTAAVAGGRGAEARREFAAAAALMQPYRRRSCIPARASLLHVHVHCLSRRSFVFALHANKSLTTTHDQDR